MLRTISRTFAVAALILAGVGAYQLLAPHAPPGHLAVDRTTTDFGTLPVGEHRIVVARVTNTGGSPASVLGVSESCRGGVCHAPADPGPLVVPPGETVDIVCLVTLHEEGRAGFNVHMYLDNGTFDRAEVQVSGIAIASPGRTESGSHNQP